MAPMCSRCRDALTASREPASTDDGDTPYSTGGEFGVAPTSGKLGPMQREEAALFPR